MTLWGILGEIKAYSGLPSIEPPTVGNPKAHKTNRLWAQVEVKPNSHTLGTHNEYN